MNSTCSSGHTHRFLSSHQINDLYASNLQVAASIMLCGNQFGKAKRIAKFLHLEFLSKSTYYRFQRLYVIPAINGWWSWMKAELVREFSGHYKISLLVVMVNVTHQASMPRIFVTS